MSLMQSWALRRAEGHRAKGDDRGVARKRKKEEFPGLMVNMPPGNSFPQICVVSVNQFVEIGSVMQEHGGSMNESNRDY
jgi:hypothetical protein